MLRLALAAVFIVATSAQTGGQNGTQCGGTTGACPSLASSPSLSPSSSKLPCCIDPARCQAGQQLCPSPSVTPAPICCMAGMNCTATTPVCPTCCPANYTGCPVGIPACPTPSTAPTKPATSLAPSALPSQRAFNTSCCDPAMGLNCTMADPTCNPSPAPTKYPNNTADCTTRGFPCNQTTPLATPRPSYSPAATGESTPRPSQQPPQPPSPSGEPTPKASERPQPPSPSGEPTQRPTLPRTPETTPRPSQIPPPHSPAASVSAAPTRRPTSRPAATPLVVGSRRPAPSRWPVPANYTPPGNFGALNGQIRLPNANNTALTQPANLQQITANIACALRQPMDTILIKNITIRYTNGTVDQVPFDTAGTTISSGGVPVCLVVPTPARLLGIMRGGEHSSKGNGKRFAQVVDAVTTVDYTIIDPSTNLLAMDTATFNTLVAADPAIISIAAIVGSTGIDVDAPPELDLTAASAAVPVVTPGSSTNGGAASDISQSTTIIYIAVGITAGAAMVSIFALVIALRVRPTATPPMQKTATTLVVLDTENPLNVSKSRDVRVIPPVVNDTAERSTFAPQSARV